MEHIEPIFSFHVLGLGVNITWDIVIQWIIILLLLGASVYFAGNLKAVPDGKQNAVEIFVETINKLVKDNMGEDFQGFVPYIGTLIIFLLLMNLAGLFGVEPPTRDYSVALSLALITFVVAQGFAIKKVGLLHYFAGYAKPFAVMLPLNIVERLMLPLSLSLRLFGNMTAAAVLVGLVYEALGHLGWIAQIGIPVPLHFYFDVFDGTIQMVIFTMLTMINIKIIAEH